MASLRGSDADVKNIEKTLSFGLDGGAALNAKFSEIMGLEVDFLYSMKGQKYSYNYFNQTYNAAFDTVTVEQGSAKGSYHLDYLDIPILLKFMVPLQSAIKPYFAVGPSFGLLLSSKDKKSGSGLFQEFPASGALPGDTVSLPISVDTTVDQKESTKSLDIGLVLGWGAEIPLGPGDFTLDMRYSFGLSNTVKLTDADKAAGFTESDLPGRLNSLFAIMVGYCYKF